MTLTSDDKEAIREVIAAYAHAIDRRRWDMMENLFHDDGTFGFGPFQGGWREFVGRASAVIGACTATHHHLGQILIGPGEQPNIAHAETYMTAMHIVPAGYTEEAFPDWGEEYSATIAGRYVDRFERRAGSWRIAHRNGIYDWREYRSIGSANLSDVPDDMRGAHDDTDPSTPVTRAWRGK